MRNAILLALTLISSSICGLVQSAERKDLSLHGIDLLARETQKESVSPLSADIAYVYWFPKEHWVLVSNLESQRAAQIMTDVMDHYMVIGITHFTVDEKSRETRFSTADEILASLSVSRIRPQKKTINLTPMTTIPPIVERIVGWLKASLKDYGVTGENMQFFVFEDKFKRSDSRRANPYEWGDLIVRFNGHEDFSHTVNFETPLDSLFVPRICPNGKPAHIRWSYCPWSGEKLPP